MLVSSTVSSPILYDLSGRQLPANAQPNRGLYIAVKDGKAIKMLKN